MTSPCWHNGNDCPRRQVGCRTACQEWHEFQEQVEKERALKEDSREFDAYTCRKYNEAMRKKRKKTPYRRNRG